MIPVDPAIVEPLEWEGVQISLIASIMHDVTQWDGVRRLPLWVFTHGACRAFWRGMQEDGVHVAMKYLQGELRLGACSGSLKENRDAAVKEYIDKIYAGVVNGDFAKAYAEAVANRAVRFALVTHLRGAIDQLNQGYPVGTTMQCFEALKRKLYADRRAWFEPSPMEKLMSGG